MPIVPIKNSFAFAATGTTADLTIHESGVVNYMEMTTPNFTNAATTKISLLDAEGTVIWDMTEALSNGAAVSAQNRNTATRYQFQYDIPVYTGWTIRATLSGDAGLGGGTVVQKMYVKK